MEQRRIGRFFVDGYFAERDVEILRAAQAGCAVLRCEYLAYRRCFEVHAEHPDFDLIERGQMTPTYAVILDDPDGQSPTRIRFERESS
jgi:hypothetical protein